MVSKSRRSENEHYNSQKSRTDERAPRRSPGQKRKDRIDVARLYVQGYSMRYIAEWLSENRDYTLSYQQVYTDVHAVEQEWRDQYLPDVDKMKAAELARLDALIQEAWKGWHDSRKDKETSESERETEKLALTEKGLLATKPFHEKTKSKLKTEGRDGSHQFLELIDKFIARRCKILGLEAPSVHEIKDWRKEAEKAGFNASQEFEKMVNVVVESDNTPDDAEQAEPDRDS